MIEIHYNDLLSIIGRKDNTILLKYEGLPKTIIDCETRENRDKMYYSIIKNWKEKKDYGILHSELE